MRKRFQIEQDLYHNGYDLVVGCDEVGRGALAGPVVAGAVSFLDKPNKRFWGKINDSKLLSFNERSFLTEEIKKFSSWSIGVVSPPEIDELNIHHAVLLAMRRAVGNLQANINSGKLYLLIDGKFIIPDFDVRQQAVVGGDGLIHSIAAASIIAKDYRDNLMIELARSYSVYGLDQHKGYATKIHRSAILKHGLSPIHRVSFCDNIA